MHDHKQAALKLHQYLVSKHWNGQVIIGPDPIGKIHWRITRFVRSYLPWLPGDDRYVYLQGQAYWIRSNAALFELTQDSRYLDLIERCADYIVHSQPDNGAWLHPPIWGRRGFISTVEGTWAGLGLVMAYKMINKPEYLAAAIKWYNFLINQTGFQPVGNGLAVNYYSHSTSRVPNVTTMTIWFTTELAQITQDKRYLEFTDRMLRFVQNSQLDSGELPYALDRIHFMCYQYNSFQFLDLAYYYQITHNQQARQILSLMAAYLATGITAKGSCRYNCFKEVPEINYWTAALATALGKAHELNLGNYLALSEQSYSYLLTQQRFEGGFNFSQRNYGFLHDRRSYPRPLAMILDHLLYRVQTKESYTLLTKKPLVTSIL